MANLILRTENGDFDLYDSEQIVQTFIGFDFSDLTTRSGEYTNNFKLPLTANNIRMTGYATSLQVSSSLVYQKINVKIIVGGLQIRSGFLVINSINENINATFFSGNTNFFDALKNQNLTDLNWSDLDHSWNYTNALAMANSTSDYCYPIVDYGNQNLASDILDIRTILPATYVSAILDRIFFTLNYNYTYNFDTTDIDKAVLPYAKKNPEISAQVSLLNQVDISNTADYHIIKPDEVFTDDNTIPHIIPPITNFLDLSYNVIDTVGSSTLWVDSTNEFTANYSGNYDFYCLIDLGANLGCTIDFSPSIKDPNISSRTALQVYKVVGGIDTLIYFRPIGTNQISSIGATNYTSINIPSILTDYSGNTATVFLNVGDKLRFDFIHSILNLQFTPSATVTQITIKRDFTVLSSSILNIDLQPQLVFGGVLTYSSMLPNIKCSDFIRDLSIRFGLILKVDDVNKMVYFNKIESIKSNKRYAPDWSDKIDFTNKHDISFKYDSYAQINNFKHKDDKTIVDTPIGSDYQLIINNATLIKEKDFYVSLFGATEQQTWSSNSIKSVKIGLYDSSTAKLSKDVAYRICFAETTTTSSFKVTDGTTTSAYIPMIKMWFVDINKPTLSMGFGSNLFEKNSSTLESVLNNLKVIKLNAKLDLIDILGYDFFTPIYIDYYKSFFIVSKINQFNYTEKKLTSVELIKLD